MSREQLLGLAADVDRLLAAGAASAESSSLRRHARALRDAGKKVAALNPVAEAVERVTGADKPGPPSLDLLLLTRQIRAGLATTGVDGPLVPLPESGPWQTPVPVRELTAAYEVLTDFRARYSERVEQAAKKRSLGDLRLATAQLAALEGAYKNVADEVAERGLPALGPGILPELHAGLNLNGKAVDARRLGAICRIDRKAGAELCRRALAEGSAVLRVEALRRFRDVTGVAEAAKEGLKYRGDKKSDVRVAAVICMGAGRSDEVLAALFAALDDKDWSVRSWAATYLGATRHPQVAARLLADLQQTLALLGNASSGKAVRKTGHPREMLVDRAKALLEALRDRKDGDRRAVARTVLPLIGGEPELSSWAGSVLCSSGPVIDEFIPVLIEKLGREDGTAADALRALSAVPVKKRRAAIPILVRLVESCKQKRATRTTALSVLTEHFGTHREAVLRAGRALLSKWDSYSWYETVHMLEVVQKMGSGAKPLLPALFSSFQIFGYVDGFVPHHVARTIVRIDPGGKETLPELIRILGGREPLAQTVSLAVLIPYGKKARSAVPAVERLAESKDRSTARQAEKTLKAIR